MARTWLVLDCNYLCWRAFYSMPQGMSHEGDPTAVLYGLFRDIMTLQEQHATNHIVFCWDKGIPLRKKLWPGYKELRHATHKANNDRKRDRKLLDKQINKLRGSVLEEIGFRNNIYQDGYEADDMIAYIIMEAMGQKDEAVIVSSDKDLYQLLSDRVIMWLPTKQQCFTDDCLMEQYNIGPSSWAHVKALAGCSTDGIPGIKGVGEFTAAKYLTGTLPVMGKTHKRIRQQHDEVYERNIPLVKLPFNDGKGIKDFDLVDDEVNWDKWNRVLKRYGMESLIRRRA